jgi:hypothetical protein
LTGGEIDWLPLACENPSISAVSTTVAVGPSTPMRVPAAPDVVLSASIGVMRQMPRDAVDTSLARVAPLNGSLKLASRRWKGLCSGPRA